MIRSAYSGDAPARATAPRVAWAFHLTVFLGAFLLFQAQPMLSKGLLPAFGGSYLVWGAAMVFFQGALLLGYACAHLFQRAIGPLRYAFIHLALLAASLAALPFSMDRLIAGGGGAPVIAVMRLLIAVAGPPFIVLSMTAVVMQRWLTVHPRFRANNPYVLYSASNLGSLLALLTYPVLVEPFLSIEQQARVWTAAYVILVVLHWICLPVSRTAPRVPERTGANADPTAGQPAASPRDMAGWFLLGLATCALLLATTNALTFEVAAVPLLWVVPLAVYLGSFVTAFRPVPWQPAWVRAAFFWAVPLGMALNLMAPFRIAPPLAPALALYTLILAAVCINCHAVLAALKPRRHSQLTSYYLTMALGGFCGGMLVSWGAPYLNAAMTLEYPGAMFLCLAALATAAPSSGSDRMVAAASERIGPDGCGSPGRQTAGSVFLAAAVAATAVGMAWLLKSPALPNETIAWMLTAAPVLLLLRLAGRRPGRLATALLALMAVIPLIERAGDAGRTVLRLRNYYGVYRVFDRDGQRYLQHGATLHGRQYLEPQRAQTPSSYYHPSAPAGSILNDPTRKFEAIGMVGLGAGALAAYAGEGQSIAVFEIDPDNLAIAENHFSYLDQARRRGARVTLWVGDGRLLLRQRPAADFDLLILDAFSSGSIPVRLITIEAFEEYFRVLRPGGMILLHVSNRMLDLEPLIFSAASRLGVRAAAADNKSNPHPDSDPTVWMALFRQDDTVGGGDTAAWLRRQGWRFAPRSAGGLPQPWTDRYSNPLRLVRFGR